MTHRCLESTSLGTLSTLTVLLLASACGSESGEADMDSNTAAITNNQVTWSQREVGTFNGCTATLISEGWFVTASHCTGHQRLTTAGLGTFQIDAPTPRSCTPSSTCPATMTCGSNGRCVWAYKVAEVFPMGPTVEPDSNGDDSNEDVLVGRLVDPVPAIIARPAGIADTPPPSGTTVTMLGYGCNNRGSRSGGGLKRFQTFPWPHTNVSCPGDSGGPVRLGTLNNPGDIFTLTVGFRERNVRSDYDIRANALIFFKRLIMARMRAEEGFEFGLDRPGFDYDNFHTDWSAYGDVWGAFQCRQACTEDARCVSYSYVHGSETCFLKNAAPDVAANSQVISGVTVGRLRYLDLPGKDYKLVPADHADECESTCAQESRCLAYSYNATGAGICRLKNGVPTTTAACTSCESGSRRGHEYLINRPGGDYRITADPSSYECAARCIKTWNCQAWTWVPPLYSNGSWGLAQCRLKGHVPDPVREYTWGRGIITSGVRRGLEVDRDRPGSDFVSFSAAYPENCEQYCEQNPQCKAWSFVEPTPQTFYGTCHLKDDIPASAFAQGVISGRKGMTFFK